MIESEPLTTTAEVSPRKKRRVEDKGQASSSSAAVPVHAPEEEVESDSLDYNHQQLSDMLLCCSRVPYYHRMV